MRLSAVAALICLSALATAPSIHRAFWRPAATSASVGVEAPSSSPVAIVPDPTLTPGAVRTTDASEICANGTAGLRPGRASATTGS